MHIPLSRPASVLLLTTLLVSGCSSTGEHRSWRLPNGQPCRSTDDPNSVDLATVLEDAGGALEGLGGSARDTLLVTVSYDSTGAMGSVRADSRPGATADTATILRRLRTMFRASGAPRTHAHGLLALGAEATLRPHQVTSLCEPQMINRREVLRLFARVATDPVAQRRSAVVWVFVDSNGEAGNAVINRSTGVIPVDREIVYVARQARFAPAHQDGFAFPVWVAIPFGVEQPNRHLRPGECPPLEVMPIPCQQ